MWDPEEDDWDLLKVSFNFPSKGIRVSNNPSLLSKVWHTLPEGVGSVLNSSHMDKVHVTLSRGLHAIRAQVNTTCQTGFPTEFVDLGLQGLSLLIVAGLAFAGRGRAIDAARRLSARLPRFSMPRRPARQDPEEPPRGSATQPVAPASSSTPAAIAFRLIP